MTVLAENGDNYVNWNQAILLKTGRREARSSESRRPGVEVQAVDGGDGGGGRR